MDLAPDSVPMTVRTSGQVAVISYVPGWVWRCEVCGWLGMGHTSESAAMREGADHLWDDHEIAGCRVGVYTDPHKYEHVPKTDSISKCQRCGMTVGK